MAGPRRSYAQMAEVRQKMLAAAFRLFAEKNIDSITLSDVAAESGCPLRTVQRYFHEKDTLVIETATWAWSDFTKGSRQRVAPGEWERMTAAQQYTFFLDSFLELYRSHRDLLCFNQMFNVYIRAAAVNTETLRPYQAMMGGLREWFRILYAKGEHDGTLRTDMDEEAMFSTTLHIMLAIVTRYAVGLVYRSESDPEQELLFQRDLLLQRFTTDAAKI